MSTDAKGPEAPKATQPVHNVLTLAAKVYRDLDDIEGDLRVAKAEYFRLEPLRRDDDAQAKARQAYWDNAEAKHKKEFPDIPFNPAQYYQPAVRPGIDEDLHKRFHRQHVILARFEKELEEAKKAYYEQ